MLDRIWEVLGYILALNGEAFRIATTVPHGLTFALVIVLFAGISQGIGQSVVLFLNEVKRSRFAISLVINAVLFTGGFLALGLSTWLVTLLPGATVVAPSKLVIVLGIAYAPLLFSFLGAMPYLGLPILNVLSIWHLLAMVVGFGAVVNVPISESFRYVGLGWVLLQVLQNTVGRPIAKLGRDMANRAAGVELVMSRRDLRASMRERLDQVPARWQEDLNQRIASLRQSEGTTPVMGDAVMGDAVMGDPSRLAGVGAGGAGALADGPTLPRVDRAISQDRNATVSTILSLGALVALTLLVLVLLRPLRQWWFGWFATFPDLVQWGLNLAWVGAVALVVAGLLAPLETLGWWAGWYDDDVNTTVNAGELAQTPAPNQIFSRYVVYLDGIGKSTFEYLPDIEEFLDTLAPTLPPDVALVRGIMPYSVMNAPLDEDRPLAFLWRYADKLRFANPDSLLGLLVNIRNVLIVGVSADKRYGPLYNQGIAQVVYNGLVKNGYPLESGIPVTFIGYSGGGQMSCASAPYLKRALGAPVDVISLGGVMSANINLLKLEHLYHLVGDQDTVERLGPKMFPGRWRVFPLSYWNRAKRRGKISIIPMGPVGHQVPGGILDPNVILEDGRSALQQTIDTINAILQGNLTLGEDMTDQRQPSHYDIFRANPLVQSHRYPLNQRPDPSHYVPMADWIGRLILPAKADRFGGAYYEIHQAPADHADLIGQVVKLRWADDPLVQRFVQAATHDLHFSADAEYSSRVSGAVHPVRINHWLQVDPLESLAGALPDDEMIVAVEDPQVQRGADGTTLRIRWQPMEVTGRYYGLVQFVAPVPGTDRFQVRHFHRTSRAFDGPNEEVRVPIPSHLDLYGSDPSTTQGLETSPHNEQGWYIYGAPDATGTFVVQAWGPRTLFRLQPERVVFGGAKTAYRYIRKEAWADVANQKGKVGSVLCTRQDNGRPEAISAAIDQWQVGDRALLLHTYGGIGGEKKEPAAFSPIFFGHFAYGRAEVVHDPLADERRFEIRYYQVYAHNVDGLIAGTVHWSRYQGDRQRGWLGNRPSCDILVKLTAFSRTYDFDSARMSPLVRMEAHLQAMTARYRIGDGTGGTFVGPSNNCSQDSNQALFASMQGLVQGVKRHQAEITLWAERHPDQAQDFDRMVAFGQSLKRALQPFSNPRPDWERNDFNLGSSLEDEPLRNLMMGLGSWRTVLPRKASDVVVRQFLQYGASAWVLRTSQIGGYDPTIAPIAPMTF